MTGKDLEHKFDELTRMEAVPQPELEYVMNFDAEVGMLDTWKQHHAHRTLRMSPTTNGPLSRPTWS